MELSSAVLDGLGLLSDSNVLSDELFKPLIKSATEGTLLQTETDFLNDDPVFKNSNKAVIKEVYASLVTFFLEAAKNDVDESSISALLEDLKISDDRGSAIQEEFRKRKPHLQLLLGRIGDSVPHIVDVDWRLDYYIKSNQLEHIGVPIYLICIKTEVPGQTDLQDVQFSCTLEQLQDFVNKLKDAVKSLERLSQT